MSKGDADGETARVYKGLREERDFAWAALAPRRVASWLGVPR